jgi:hypothetical protein
LERGPAGAPRKRVARDSEQLFGVRGYRRSVEAVVEHVLCEMALGEDALGAPAQRRKPSFWHPPIELARQVARQRFDAQVDLTDTAAMTCLRSDGSICDRCHTWRWA